jgi:two-component system phosphate regulon response regulator OmpR
MSSAFLDNAGTAGLANRTVLLVDDDDAFCQEIRDYLRAHGLVVEVAHDMVPALHLLQSRSFDMVLLDLMLGHGNGMDLLRELRKTSDAPCLVITGRNDVTDKIVGLELGADDYLFKPVNMRELLARMRALLRRAGRIPGEATSQRGQGTAPGWRFDPARRNLAAPDGGMVPLTSAECDVLIALVSHEGCPQTRADLCLKVFQREWQPNDRSLDGVIVNLRRKLEPDPERPLVIQSVRGKGYVFTGFPPVNSSARQED